MIRAFAFAFALGGAVASAAAEPDWPVQLAKSLADGTEPWTNASVAERLDPPIRFGAAPCATARAPGPGGAAPVTSAVVFYADPQACNTPTALVSLQLALSPVSAAQRAGFGRTMTAVAAPCFAGRKKINERSRAEPAEITGWRFGDSVVAMVRQPEFPDAITVSLTRQHAGGDPAIAESVLASLPESCR